MLVLFERAANAMSTNCKCSLNEMYIWRTNYAKATLAQRHVNAFGNATEIGICG